MASTTSSLPVPVGMAVSPAVDERSGSKGSTASASASESIPDHQRGLEVDGGFYSTTTAPLKDYEHNGMGSSENAPGGAPRNRTASTSVIDRPRPKPPTASSERPSSFFGVDASADSAPKGHFVEQLDDTRPPLSHSSATNEDEGPPRPSSFYGLDAHTLPTAVPDPSRSRSSGTRPQTHNSSSGSGSYSSHELAPAPDQNHHRPRYSQTPYASSRAGSMFGISAGADPTAMNGPTYASSVMMMDQSHLQPGSFAALLSHEKTLELYRQNAKKTNDPHIQFEFCAFVMEVVAELEQQAAVSTPASGPAATDGSGSGEEVAESRRKQKALVTESITLLNKLAQRGHVKSQYFLADCYTQGVGTIKGKRDYDKAFPLFMLAGKHGHADASFRAAQCLEHGWGCRKDQAKAVSLYRRAAVLSHPGSMHRLGLAEINGELGLSKRPKDGVQWLKRAAELADQVDPPQPQSLHELAILHEKGIDNVVFQDEEYAAELLARASELQFAPSAYKLGECYEYGKMGCPQDAALSIHYYNIAAQQNHPAACFALTAWYLVGSPGILPQSDTEAYLWAKKSAELGFAKAEYACGYFTESGIGTYKDSREALEWFQKAASHGDKRALDRLRAAGQPIPARAPALRHTPSSNALASANNGPPLPEKTRTTNKILSKNKQPQPPVQPVPRSQQPRSESTGRIPRPISKDVKGKGREDNGASNVSRPGFSRQRSNSQPTPFDQRRYQYDSQPQSYSQGQNDFNPLPYSNVPAGATVGARPQHPRDGGAGYYAQAQPQAHQQQQQQQRNPRQPPQVRMPLRQQVNGAVVPEDSVKSKAEREHVLQRRAKGGAEDKDCTIM
ncbi:tetratricopeptide repeat protein [Sporobolomyces koalae]|uniref:tetratricopeptide repeat protein n=1 Tax=Sporobolomyces koalae TaxID=500713 RepID=UPI00316DDD31